MRRLGPAVLLTGAALLGTGLLAAGVVDIGGAGTVPGAAVAAPHAALADDGHAYPAGMAAPAPRPPGPAQPPQAPRPVAQAHPAPAPAPDAGPPRSSVNGGQRPGTIRLPHGGTATLVRAEVGPDRTLPIPDGVREATWWGSALGASQGATVFAGHINWSGQTGPFDELWQSRVGDVVTVRDTAGTVWRYRVSDVRTLTKDQLPAQAPALFGQDGPHRVVLVTCGGRWVGGELGYASNRIVIATPMR